ncbi:MAG: heavy metal translocating P-type ATPase [Alphaproteobacteria bacterium]|uniref:Heavy metal translocating P-type ATPase n=1 Tax=Candidatus Nitrobium versatile TaxID=2884831 RepID=A0A953JCQ5_9BACT|nr:heavy metal translocating P-type ATPase [Candidatus Nitrobium versatile]
MHCDHCLLGFPEKDAVYDDRDGQTHVFCCHGCRGIYTLIHAEGLDDFYEKRKWSDAGVPAVLKKGVDLRPFAEQVRDVGGEKELDILIDGIRCASCVWLNEKILGRTDGVAYARVNYAIHRARIRWNPDRIGLDRILSRIVSIGYQPRPYSESEHFRARKAETRDLLVRFGTAGFLSSQLMIYSVALYAGYFQGIEPSIKFLLEMIALLLTLPVLFYSGMPFLRNTLIGLRRLHFTMDSLITLGAGSAFVYSVYQMAVGGAVYFDTAAMIITLILLGRYIEATAKGRASEAIERLSELSPKEARRLLKGIPESGLSGEGTVVPESERVPLSSVSVGDLLQVLPGEKVPLDGVVVSGGSEVDESLITGESKPVAKTPGREVVGGSVNLFGTLSFEVTRTGKDTVLAGIIRAVEDAQARKPRIQQLADRIVGLFVPAILLIALATVAGYLAEGAPSHSALMAGISVLVIACPCSLGLATPLAVLLFTSLASAKGILVRGGEVIENTSGLTHVLFDKTGTITVGEPTLKEILVLDPGQDRERILSLAASLESLSGHSIGRAITRAAEETLLPVSDFRALPGRGIEGIVENRKVVIGNRALMQENGVPVPDIEEVARRHEGKGDTVILMGWEGKARALFIVSDVVREEAAEVIAGLKKKNTAVFLASGDNRITTDAVASSAGIEEAVSEASPEKKREVIAGIREKGGKVMMVGDGINDAPALTEALVGVAMGRGTDIAMESADAVLVRNDLRLIPYFLHLSARTYSIIKQNIFWAFFYNVVAIPLAVSGTLHPIVAAGAMAASSLAVVLNSLRIKRIGNG